MKNNQFKRFFRLSRSYNQGKFPLGLRFSALFIICVLLLIYSIISENILAVVISVIPLLWIFIIVIFHFAVLIFGQNILEHKLSSNNFIHELFAMQGSKADIPWKNIVIPFRLLLRQRIYGLWDYEDKLHLPSFSSDSRIYFNHTGHFCISTLIVEYSDFTGLFFTGFKVPVKYDFYVLPEKAIFHESFTLAGSGIPENIALSKSTQKDEYYDHREYVPGDEIKLIHWKLSAKSDNLMVRQPENSLAPVNEILILIDTTVKESSPIYSTLHSVFSSRVLGIFEFFKNQNLMLHIFSVSQGRVITDPDTRQIDRIAATINFIPHDEELNFHAAKKIEHFKNINIIFISCLFDDSLLNQISSRRPNEYIHPVIMSTELRDENIFPDSQNNKISYFAVPDDFNPDYLSFDIYRASKIRKMQTKLMQQRQIWNENQDIIKQKWNQVVVLK